MRTPSTQRGFTLIELLVVIAIIAILASILFPVFTKAQAKARQTTCLSNIRQMSTATLMFVQDNKSRYPDAATWASDLQEYVGNPKIYTCPSDQNGDGYVSYAYSGLLVGVDGKGIYQNAITNAAELGLFVDGTSQKFPNCSVLNWAGQTGTSIEKRHSLCLSCADGHAESIGAKVSMDSQDNTSPVGRGFYLAAGFGWVNNAGAGVFKPATTPTSGAFAITGSTTCQPIINSAVAGWSAAGGDTPSVSLLGSGDWGSGDVGFASGKKTTPGSGLGTTDTDVIATDAIGIIVSDASKIGLKKLNRSQLIAIFNGTDTTYPYKVYTRDTTSGTRQFFEQNVLGGTLGTTITSTATTVSSSTDMIAKVSGDPYGIGYCSLGEADPWKVNVLGYTTSGGVDQTFTRAAVEYSDPTSASGWILQRPLFSETTFAKGVTGKTTNAAATAFVAYIKSTTFKGSLLFSSSFFQPKATVAAYPTTY